jgi:phosphoenolpyruvate carboxylase
MTVKRSRQPTGHGARETAARTVARDPLAGDALGREVKLLGGLLGGLLGQVIAEQGGPELLALVERCRLRSVAFRESGDEAAGNLLAAELDALDIDRAESLANAFSLYFGLVNLAEERDSVRRQRQGQVALERPVEGTPAAAIEWLLDRGWTGERVVGLLGRLRITPVLTAHPTEARRRTMLTALRRCYRLLDQLDDPRLGATDGAETRRRLREEISILWRSSAVRRLAPSPMEEVRTALTFFDETLFRAVPRVYRAFDRALDRGAGEGGPGHPDGVAAGDADALAAGDADALAAGDAASTGTPAAGGMPATVASATVGTPATVASATVGTPATVASATVGTWIDSLRAIPWVFSWSQARIGLPARFGLGSALEGFEQAHGPGSLAHVAELYRDWPFLTSALDNAELILGRSEPQIAGLYAALAGNAEGDRLWRRILDEYERSIRGLAKVTGRSELLAAEPLVGRSTRLRRPYIDPLSHIQVRFLARLRSLPADDPDRERYRRLVQLTVNGVAAGPQNTG